MSATRGRFSLTPPRWRDGAWEIRCRSCGDWWPLTPEFYSTKHGTARCRACWAEYHRLHEERRRRAPESITGYRLTRRAAYFGANAEKKRESCKRWRAANPDKVREYNRIYRERRKAAA